MDDAEAAHYVVSATQRRTRDRGRVWRDAFHRPEHGERPELNGNDPDSRLRTMLFELLPSLAKEIGFKLR